MVPFGWCAWRAHVLTVWTWYVMEPDGEMFGSIMPSAGD